MDYESKLKALRNICEGSISEYSIDYDQEKNVDLRDFFGEQISKYRHVLIMLDEFGL